jgi:putative flippase GtrA
VNTDKGVDARLPRPIKYLLIGALNTVFGFGLFALCYVALDGRIPHAAILVLTHVLAVSFSFTTHRMWVFTDASGGSFVAILQALLRFQFAYLGLLALGLAVNGAMLRWVVSSPWLAQLAAMAVGVASGYLIHKSYVFRVRD